MAMWKEEWAFMNTDVFAGTKIDPGVLVQKLDPDTRSVASIRRGAEARAVLPKKEKLKLRRERWLQTFQGETWHRANEQTRERRARIFHVQQALGLPAVPLEIEAIKLAEQKRKAERRRRATVVVGDLQPLRDALPELLELEAGSRQRRARGRRGTEEHAGLHRDEALSRSRSPCRSVGRGRTRQAWRETLSIQRPEWPTSFTEPWARPLHWVIKLHRLHGKRFISAGSRAQDLPCFWLAAAWCQLPLCLRGRTREFALTPRPDSDLS
uniref:Family with sequence similarity 207 member A n=2 Tax=Ailuropoda melanoleuca TaxID=9646 RepID=A0A7N5K388_AILME